MQCSSGNTKEYGEGRTNDEGWRPLGRIGALGSEDAEELLESARREYIVIDDEILVWTSRVFKVSFDGCGSFATWSPMGLPDDRIDPVEKPDYCAPKGTTDCSNDDFSGSRTPVYSDIRARSDGTVSFTVQSKTFKPSDTLTISSHDFGRTWQESSVPFPRNEPSVLLMH